MNLKKLDILFNYEIKKPYKQTIDNFLKKHQTKNEENNYILLELIINEIYNFKYYLTDEEEQQLILFILEKIKPYLNNDKLLKRYINLIEISVDKLDEKIKQILIEFLYKNINLKNINLIIFKFKNILKIKKSEPLAIYTVKILEKYHKDEAIKTAHTLLEYPQICDYLLNIYRDKPNKRAELLLQIAKNSQN